MQNFRKKSREFCPSRGRGKGRSAESVRLRTGGGEEDRRKRTSDKNKQNSNVQNSRLVKICSHKRVTTVSMSKISLLEFSALLIARWFLPVKTFPSRSKSMS